MVWPFLLWLGVLLNVATLFWYKFTLETSFRNVDASLEQANVFLDVGIPLGISFYTFYQISFLIDTYKSDVHFLSFQRYSLSASMFSQLPAGPILNYNDGLNQFGHLGEGRVQRHYLFKGLSLFSFGLVKKVLLADHLGMATNQVHYAISDGQTLNALESFVASWGFLLQLYFDFSAYSDMAIGLGLCFGLTFPINFNSPFKAKTFTDFISRWHMSLIGFTRTYIFLPVTKVVKKIAKGKAVRRQFISWMVGLQVSFLVINIWHAPTLMLVLQGLFLGFFFVMVKLASMAFEKISRWRTAKIKWIRSFKAGLNQVLVLTTISVFAVLLRTRSFNEVITVFSGFKKLPGLKAEAGGFPTQTLDVLTSYSFFPSIEDPIKLMGADFLPIPLLPFLILLSLITLMLPNTMQIFGLVRMPEGKWYSDIRWQPNLAWGIITGFTLALYAMVANENLIKEFLYGGF